MSVKYPNKVLSYAEGIKRISEFNLITLVGEEKFFRDQAKNKKIASSNGDLISIDCSERNEESILNEIQYKDLFNSKRIFWLTNFTKIKNLKFFTLNSFDDVIILDSEKPTKTIAFKELETKSLYIDCNIKPWEKDSFALEAINRYFQSNGHSLDADVANYLYGHIGFDLYKLYLETQKIILLKNDKSRITKEDVDTICVLNKNYNIFDLIDKILDNNKKDALILLEKIYFYENTPSILLISLWFTHLENILYIKNNKKGEEQLYSYIKLPPTVIRKKLIPQAKKISNEKILNFLNFLATLDANLRRGSFDLKFYIEKFIIDF